jgi:hypothetical protein
MAQPTAIGVSSETAIEAAKIHHAIAWCDLAQSIAGAIHSIGQESLKLWRYNRILL